MTEPIEKWREEARQYIESIPGSMDDWDVCDIKRAYIAGKMSQPVVDIPAPGKTDHVSAEFYACKIFQALTAAGIQYRIKGE